MAGPLAISLLTLAQSYQYGMKRNLAKIRICIDSRAMANVFTS